MGILLLAVFVFFAVFADVVAALYGHSKDTVHPELVVEQWEGGSSSEYMTAQKDWDDSAAELQTVLKSIGDGVVDASDGYVSTEASNKNRWAG